MQRITKTDIDTNTGLAYLSAGLCPNCDECRDAYNCTAADIEEGRVCDEGCFSWHGCDICSTRLGGYRYAAHGIDPETGGIVHLDVCDDCLIALS